MEVKNKFEKILLSLSGVLLSGLVILGFKVQADQKTIESLSTSNASTNAMADAGVVAQGAIQANRDSNLNAAAHSPLTSTTTTTTTATVVPGKTITQTVPVSTTSTTSSKKTKTS